MRRPTAFKFEPVEWLASNLRFKETNSAVALYDRMESQSGECLPVIYVPFDASNRMHFTDRGQILDYAAVAGGGRVLDFGPGDGWPSLLLAPMVDEVIGVDGSQKRVDVCAQNAGRLGIKNARFVYSKPGEPIPFKANSFDAVCAASSIEQTPDVWFTLKEIFRVLKPGGRLRMHYESLSYYRDGLERDVCLVGGPGKPVLLVVFDRVLRFEYVRHYGLLLDISREELLSYFGGKRENLKYCNLTEEILTGLKGSSTEAVTWVTKHPSCRSLVKMLLDAKFGRVRVSHNGGWFARRYFDALPEHKRPASLEEVDELLRPMVEVVVKMNAPQEAKAREWEPWISAVK